MSKLFLIAAQVVYFTFVFVFDRTDTVSGMETDPFDTIKKELGLSNDPKPLSSSSKTEAAVNPVTRNNRKWKQRPGYYAEAARDHRQVKTYMKKNPTVSFEEAKKMVEKERRRNKFPPEYFRKEGFIQRQKIKVQKEDPTLSPNSVDKKVSELYTSFTQKRRENSRKRRADDRQARQFLEGIDKNLAKSLRYPSLNTKQEWIDRKIRSLQKGNIQLTRDDAHTKAHSLYLEKLAKARDTKRKKREERLNQNTDKAST